MAQSINTRADLTVPGISYMGFADYGNIMMGDVGFEYFNDKNVEKNIQLPYASIRFVEADVSRSGKIGRQFRIALTTGQQIRFSSKESGKILKLFREHLGNARVVRAKSFFDVIFGFLNRNKKK
jgi:hypothetical protein